RSGWRLAVNGHDMSWPGGRVKPRLVAAWIRHRITWWSVLVTMAPLVVECLPPPQPPAACTAAGTLFRIPRGVAGLSGHGGDRAASVGGGVVTMHARRRERRPVTLAVAGVSCAAVEPPPRWVTPAAARRFGASPGGHGLCGH